jgi:hypothetical protein
MNRRISPQLALAGILAAAAQALSAPEVFVPDGRLHLDDYTILMAVDARRRRA